MKARKGKIKWINEPFEVKGFVNLRQSIKVKVGEELYPVYGDEGDFDDYAEGATVFIRKNGKAWELCEEGDEDVAEKPKGRQNGSGYQRQREESKPAATKKEFDIFDLRTRSVEVASTYCEIIDYLRGKLGQEVPQTALMSAAAHVLSETVKTLQ